MRSYAGFTQEEKEQVYSLARAGVPDEVICRPGFAVSQRTSG